MPLLLSCSSDPGAGRVLDKTPTEELLDWMQLWDDEADVWSRAYFAVVKEFSARDGPLSIGDVRTWGRSLDTAASTLHDALLKTGMPDFVASPTYSDALSATIGRVTAATTPAMTCDARTCADDLEAMIRASHALELLVVKTAGVKVTPSGQTRTEPIADALLSAADIGGAPLGDRVDPVEYLCQPPFETTDALHLRKAPTSTAQTAASTADRLPTFHLAQQWASPTEASRYFETVEVRTITCPLETMDAGGGFTTTWRSSMARDLSVHTVAWRITTSDGVRSLHSHCVMALVDDWVVSILVLSALQPPTEDVAEDLLRREVQRLGVEPEPAATTPSKRS